MILTILCKCIRLYTIKSVLISAVWKYSNLEAKIQFKVLLMQRLLMFSTYLVLQNYYNINY